MQREGERVGACKDAIERIAPIIFTPFFLNSFAYFPYPLLHLIFLFREESVPSAGKIADFRVGRCN